MFSKNPQNAGVNTTGRYFEFDIFAKASVNNTILCKAAIRIEYKCESTNRFYPKSAARGYITLINGIDFNNTNYEAATVYDYKNSIISIYIGTGTIDPVLRTEITTLNTGQQLVHVKIKIKNDKDDAELTLTDGGDS